LQNGVIHSEIMAIQLPILLKV